MSAFCDIFLARRMFVARRTRPALHHLPKYYKRINFPFAGASSSRTEGESALAQCILKNGYPHVSLRPETVSPSNGNHCQHATSKDTKTRETTFLFHSRPRDNTLSQKATYTFAVLLNAVDSSFIPPIF